MIIQKGAKLIISLVEIPNKPIREKAAYVLECYDLSVISSSQEVVSEEQILLQRISTQKTYQKEPWNFAPDNIIL